jgi:hypothetical protein
MPEYPEVLLSKAFKIIPGTAYNLYLSEARSGSDQNKVFYEVSLMGDRPWAYLRDQVYPAFARYLKDKSLDPERADGVVVAVFKGDHCYLIEGGDFIKAFQEMEGLNQAAFHFRVLRWLSEGQ